jgi:hypothetical protein
MCVCRRYDKVGAALRTNSGVRYTLDVPDLPQTATSEANPATDGDSAVSVATRVRVLNWSGIVFAILQSACTAVLAISGLRVAIGLSALAAAAGIHAPAKGFHQDAIRIPMLVVALAGAAVNLFVIWKIRKLRRNPASQWRQKPVPAAKLRSERWQIALATGTLLLVAAEWITHPMVHRVP